MRFFEASKFYQLSVLKEDHKEKVKNFYQLLQVENHVAEKKKSRATEQEWINIL